MKQIGIFLITLIVVIGAGIWELSYLKESSSFFMADISNVYQITERHEYELAQEEAKNLKKTWKEIRKTWSLFIDDNKMDEIGDKLVSFVSYIKNKDQKEIDHSYQCLSNSVNSIIEFECLKPENVF